MREVQWDRVSGLSAASLQISASFDLAPVLTEVVEMRRAMPGQEAPHHAGRKAAGMGTGDAGGEEFVGNADGLSPALQYYPCRSLSSLPEGITVDESPEGEGKW